MEICAGTAARTDSTMTASSCIGHRQRQFQTTMVVPAAPWLKTNPPRVAPLASGTYSIGIQCLTEVKGCVLLGTQGSAMFHLQVSDAAALSWCATQASCAQL